MCDCLLLILLQPLQILPFSKLIMVCSVQIMMHMKFSDMQQLIFRGRIIKNTYEVQLTVQIDVPV